MSGDLEKITSTIDEKVSRSARRIEQDGRRLRAETSDMCADLEELCLQIYEEHETAIAEERAMNEKLRATMEAEQAAHRAALTAQQGQIDALAAALRRQQELLDEHVSGTAAQMKAVQAEATELHRAFKAQGAAVQATKGFIGAVDEKLSAQIAEHSRASDAAAAATATSWEARHAEQRAAVERVLAWEPQLRANEEAIRTWRVGVDEAILRSEQRGTAAVSAAQTILDAGRVEMADAVGKASQSVKELEQRWPDWVSELREQQAALSVRKANASEVSDRMDEIESRMVTLTRQMTSSLPDVLERVGQLEQPRLRQAEQMEEVTRALTKASAELTEMRASSRHAKQQLGALTSERQSQAATLASLDTRMRQYGSSAEEQARYLVALSDALHDKGIPVAKYRSAYIVHPRTAPSAMPGAGSDVRPAATFGLGAGSDIRPVGSGASSNAGGGFFCGNPASVSTPREVGASTPAGRAPPATGFGLVLDAAPAPSPAYHADELARGADFEARDAMREAIGGLI